MSESALIPSFELLVGKRLENIYDEFPYTFWFRFEGQILYLSAIPACPFFSLLPKGTSLRRLDFPTPFCRFLRHHLRGQILKSWEKPEGERLLYLHFSRHTLVLEYIPKRSNLILLCEEEILGLLFPREERDRLLKPSELYIPPEPRKRYHQEGKVSFEEFRKKELEYFVEKFKGEKSKKLRRREKQIVKTLEKIQQEQKENSPDFYLKQGELLKANYHLLRKGMKEIRVTDYTQTPPKEVTLSLDPSKSPKENLEFFFHQYRRALRGEKKRKERYQRLERELEELRSKLAWLENLSFQEALDDFWRDYVEKLKKGVKKEKKEERKPYRRFISYDGWEIFVGKSAKDNQVLTFQVARGRDYFFHVDHVPGSHVVVRIPHRDTPLPQETLLDAATLALYFSKLRGRDEGEILYTPVKYVRRGKNMALGQVSLICYKKLHLRVEPERLKRLLEQARQEESL